MEYWGMISSFSAFRTNEALCQLSYEAPYLGHITLWHTKYVSARLVSARLISGLNYYLVFMYLIQDIGLKGHVTLIPSIQYVSYYVKLIKWELLLSPGSVVWAYHKKKLYSPPRDSVDALKGVWVYLWYSEISA
jgi:hypothetical protein